MDRTENLTDTPGSAIQGDEPARTFFDYLRKAKEDGLEDVTVWEHALEHSFGRGIPSSVLIKMGEREYRENIISQIKDGSYEILPPRVAAIPKDDGGVRNVYINTNQDRVILSAIYNVFYRLYIPLVHKKCVSYTVGSGVNKISRAIRDELGELPKIEATTGRQFMGCKLDIRKYFDSVPKEQLYALLEAMSQNTAMDKLIIKYYQDDRILQDEEVVPHYKSLAQGCALSALLANLALRQLDEKMDGLCKIYYRYSDDILFFTDDILGATAILVDELQAMGLDIHPDKISVFTDDFEFLGVRFKNGERRLGEKAIREFKQQIRAWTKSSKKTKDNEAQLQSTIRKIQKKCFGTKYNTVYNGCNKDFCWAAYMFSVCDSAEDFEMLDRFAKDSLRRQFTGRSNFTHNIHKLSNLDLCRLGWISFVHMYKVYNLDKGAYALELGGLNI